MFHALISRFRRAPAFEAAAPASQDQVDAPTEEAGPRLLVRASSLRNTEADPGALVADIAFHVSVLTERAQHRREDLPREALLLFHADRYRREVNAYGHTGFVARCDHGCSGGLDGIGRALRACGAAEYSMLYERMQTWLALNPEEAGDLTGDEGEHVPELDTLDAPFHALEARMQLDSRLVEWLAAKPWIQPVEDADYPRVLREAIAKDVREHGAWLAECVAGIERFLTNPAHVGFGMAAASMARPEPLIRIGSARQLTVGPDTVATARWMRTTSGERFGVLLDEGFALFEAIPEEGAESRGFRSLEQLRKLRHDRIDEILFNVPHGLGQRLSIVTREQVKQAVQLCRHLQAATAIHLLLERLETPATLTCASVHSIGKGRNTGIEAVVMLVADDATRAFAAVVSEDGATLLAEPSHEVLLKVDRDEIEAHRQRSRAA